MSKEFLPASALRACLNPISAPRASVRRSLWALSLLLVGCGEGTWQLNVWGEDYIATGIPVEIFADGCSVVFTDFRLPLQTTALLDGNGEALATQTLNVRYQLVGRGPQVVTSLVQPAGRYPVVEVVTGPVTSAQDSGPLEVAGVLSCGARQASFAWQFETVTTYRCEPENLMIPNQGDATTELTVHGDHLFYDSLEDPEAAVRGEPLLNADHDEDGVLTQAELEATSLAQIGYDVGRYDGVVNLWQFVSVLTQTIGHVDGEGHCAVPLQTTSL